MNKVTLSQQAYGWLCEIRNAAGMLIAQGFCNNDFGALAKAEAVKRCLAQLW